MAAPLRRFRRGMAAVIAMLYLALFAVLAVGFYAGTNVGIQAASNEQRGSSASLAAESGMEFVRYQLAQIVVPHGTPLSGLFAQVYSQLQTNLNNTSNFAGKSITLTNSVISIPGGAGNYVTLDSNGGRFSGTIEYLGQKLRVKVVGQSRDNNFIRAVQMDYDLAERTAPSSTTAWPRAGRSQPRAPRESRAQIMLRRAACCPRA